MKKTRILIDSVCSVCNGSRYISKIDENGVSRRKLCWHCGGTGCDSISISELREMIFKLRKEGDEENGK